MSTELQKMGEELAAKRKAAHEFYEKKESGAKFTSDEVEDFRQKRAELDDLQKKYAQAEADDKWYMESKGEMARYDRPVPPVQHNVDASRPGESAQGEVKTLGEMFTDSQGYQDYIHGRKSYKDIVLTLPTNMVAPNYMQTKTASGGLELKVMGMSNSLSGFVPKNVRSDTVIPGALQPPMVRDIIPSYNTQNQITKWMRESTTTNNAAAQAEGGAAVSESVLVWTETTAPVEKVSSFITVTQEQLDDVDNIQNLINERLSYMHDVKEDYYLLNGTGSTPQIVGLNASAMTGEQSQAAGTDSAFDAVMKGIVKVQTGASSLGIANPTNVVMNPSNWQTIILTTTADGIYIYGSPANQPAVPTLWGLPVCLTTNQTANTAIVGDFRRGVRMARRQGVTLDMSDSHASNFTINEIVIKTTSRFNLEQWIPAGFCFVTGLS